MKKVNTKKVKNKGWKGWERLQEISGHISLLASVDL